MDITILKDNILAHFLIEIKQNTNYLIFTEMKTKLFFASMLFACAALMVNAQGYKDGIDFYKIGKYDDAKELLERNLSTASNKAEAYYYLGQVALHQGEKALAKSYFDKGVQADAKYPFNYIGMAAIELQNGNEKGAENFYKQAEKCTKKNPKVAVAMAKTYFEVDANKYSKKIDKLTQNAFKWNSEDPDYYIFQGDMLGVQKQWGAAGNQYELAFQREPANIESRVKYARVDFFLDENRAVKALEDLLSLVPNSALVQRELAEKYYDAEQIKGNLPKAVEYYGMYYNNPNHFEKDEVRYAQLLWITKNYDKSLAVCNSLISKTESPANKFFGYRLKFYNQCSKSDWESAVVTGAEFFALPESSATPYLVSDYSYYAAALNNTNRGAEAVAVFEKAIEQYPDNNDLRAQLASFYSKNKDYVKAANLRQEIVNGGNYTTGDLYQLGSAYCRVAENVSDEAIKQDAILKAKNAVYELIEKEPNDLANINLLARVETLIENNEYKGGALNTYQKLLTALDANKNDPNANYYYIMAYRYMATYYSKNGQAEVANEYYKKWLQYDPENESLRKYVDQLNQNK